eukprot:SAG22_NODE_4704_length_1186_cov_3.561178_2_plen_151_part_00
MLAAADVAETSSLCDTLREELNKKRIEDAITDIAALNELTQLEMALDRLNQSQGLGFVVFNIVVDKVTLTRLFFTICSILATVIPFIMGLRPIMMTGQTPTAVASECTLTDAQLTLSRTFLQAMLPQNSSIGCEYNIYVSEILASADGQL